MKKRLFILLGVLLSTSLAVACLGGFLLTHLSPAYEKYREESVISLPFVLLRDGKLDDLLWKKEPPTTKPVIPETTSPAQPDPTQTQPQADPSATPGTSETTLPPETTVPPTTQPAPKLPVYGEDESFFDDVLFIGDSRLCGLRDYARLGNADYFCDVGMTIFNLWDRTTSDVNFGSTDLSSLLAQKQYGKIYIALGINECGYPMDSIRSEYANLIENLRESQPEATLVAQSIMTVGREFANSASYFAIDHLAEINRMFAGFADNERIFYLDVNEAVADADGYLPEEMSSDGCHLYAVENETWARWLCQSAKRIV